WILNVPVQLAHHSELRDPYHSAAWSDLAYRTSERADPAMSVATTVDCAIDGHSTLVGWRQCEQMGNVRRGDPDHGKSIHPCHHGFDVLAYREKRWSKMSQEEREEYITSTLDVGSKRLDFRFAH
ncbi:hypothetical protein WICPIJ_002491, partial [Wickerhamomyces pijperi]